jgi:hypothetical protein
MGEVCWKFGKDKMDQTWNGKEYGSILATLIFICMGFILEVMEVLL